MHLTRAVRGRTRLFAVLAVGVVVIALGVGGAVWLVVQLNEQLLAPGIPGATGSGSCSPADAVNLEFAFADGQAVQACTRDRPACPRKASTLTINGQTESGDPQLSISNQLRSSSRRYIFFMKSDLAFAADMSEQALVIDPAAFQPMSLPASVPLNSSTPAHALLEVTPRDHSSWAYIPGSGTIKVSSTHGVVHGTIDASISTASRSDRPQPSTGPMPLRITGTFTCNQ
jgi:hypothetical protein